MDWKRFYITLFVWALCLAALWAGWRAGHSLGLLYAALALLLVLCLCALWLVRVVLRRRTGLLANIGLHRGTHTQQNAKTRAFIEESEALLAPLGWQDVHITAQDSTRLHGYYIPGAPGEARTVVLLHGYSRRALQMANYALFWHKRFGINVLMPDARAHGQSGGRWCGMSYYEKHDALQWLQWLAQKHGPNAAFALHGISMGASTALAAAGCAPPPQLKLLVADCGFTDAYSEFHFQLQRRFHVPAFPVLPLAALFARVGAGYWMHEASALKDAPHVTLPTLFVHGLADDFVPTAMAQPLYQATASEDKQLLLVPGAGHVQAFYTDPAAYQAAVARFVQQYLQQ